VLTAADAARRKRQMAVMFTAYRRAVPSVADVNTKPTLLHAVSYFSKITIG